MKNHWSLLAFAAVLLAACDTVDPGDFEQEYVVEAYLIAAEPLQPVRLSRTAPINQTYDFTALSVRKASVRLDLLGADGDVEASYTFRENSDPRWMVCSERGARQITLFRKQDQTTLTC